MAEEQVSIYIVRMFRHLVLGSGYRLTDPAQPEIKIGNPILQHARIRIGVERHLVLLDRLGRDILPPGRNRLLFIELRKPVVVVGVCVIDGLLSRCRLRTPRRRLRTCKGRRTESGKGKGNEGCAENSAHEGVLKYLVLKNLLLNSLTGVVRCAI